MIYFTLNWFISFAITLFLIKTRKNNILLDFDLSGAQKIHRTPVPRVGGLGIYLSLWILLAYITFTKEYNYLLQNFLTASLPIFCLGLIEDLTKNISPQKRLLAAFISSALGIYLTNSYISYIDVKYLDSLFTFLPFAYLFTAFAVAGVINSINIIDGLNGLASIVSCIMFLSMAYLGWKEQDIQVVLIALGCIGAILGFFVFNFPRGFIFLGDGGAYFIGFMLAQISIYLVYTHKNISPWYPLLLFIYPIFETLFSIYRRKILRGISPGLPDGIHLHMLIYKRLMRWMVGSNINAHITKRNSLTSPYLWVLSAMAVIPATLFYNKTFILQIFCLIFIISYVWLYIRIIKFKSPKWLIVKKTDCKNYE